MTSNWTIRIGRVNEVEIVRRNRRGKFGAGEEDPCTLFFTEFKMFLDISER